MTERLTAEERAEAWGYIDTALKRGDYLTLPDRLLLELREAGNHDVADVIAARDAAFEQRDAALARETVLRTALLEIAHNISLSVPLEYWREGFYRDNLKLCIAIAANALASPDGTTESCACSPGDLCSCAYDCVCREQMTHIWTTAEGWKNIDDIADGHALEPLPGGFVDEHGKMWPTCATCGKTHRAPDGTTEGE